MVKLTIDTRDVEVEDGKTVLDAARKLGIEIPVMCHKEGIPPFTSCMMCVVKNEVTGKLIPACSALAENGMSISSDNENIHNARKTALELLLSDHSGDCEAPCQRTCPANLDIPAMCDALERMDYQRAEAIVTAAIPFPSIIGRICPAPCEKACRRAILDSAVSICMLKRCVGDRGLAAEHVPACADKNGKLAVIVGAGPAGLSAAYYLLLHGFSCTIIESKNRQGGMLWQAGDERLPADILEKETNVVNRMGGVFTFNRSFGADVSLEELRGTYDYVVLTPGPMTREQIEQAGLTASKTGIAVDRTTFMTGVKNVYAGGGCVQGGKMAVRSVAHGRIIAENIIRHALGTITGAGQWEFNFSSGKPGRDECENLAGDSAGIARSQKEKTNPEGLTEQEAAQEAQRCLHCDCAKRDTCTLRTYAQRYGVSPNAYASEKLKPIRRTTQHPRIVYEQNKCIRCGLCVRITEKANERFGLAFFGRGFGVEIVPALGVSMGEAVTSTVDECVLSCPTGALSYKR